MAMILLQIPQDEFSIEDVQADPDAVCLRLHKIAKEHIEDELSDPEAYVPEMYEEEKPSCILGAVEPERLITAVQRWNGCIHDDLLRAIGEYILAEGSEQPEPAAQLDTAETYSLKKAALAADNCFFDFAAMIVDLPNEKGGAYLKAIISGQELSAIQAAPEKYAIIPVQVK